LHNRHPRSPQLAYRPQPLATASAWRFIIFLGLVSLGSDFTYEAGRSISGPFLGLFKADALVVAVVAGLGEFLGYALRLASGYLADRSGKYWALTGVGYALNLLAVPLLALAWRWEVAAALLLLERMGKAIRTPARDAMLSHATVHVGRGWGFGFHEAMDQLGATLGPLAVAAVLFFTGSYRAGFAILLVPALLALGVLTAAARLYPQPQSMEKRSSLGEVSGLGRPFWLYLLAVGLMGAGFVDFPLTAFHFREAGRVPDAWIPIFYAVAMAVDALAALVWGRLFDRLGFGFLMAVPVLACPAAPLVFLGGFGSALLGMVFWGVGMGALESVMKAALAELAPPSRRGSAYGAFHGSFGLLWLLGSAAMGGLYGISLPGLAIFAVGLQLLAVPLLFLVSREVCRVRT
jgi:MFS family permease